MTLFDQPLPGLEDVRGLARYGDPTTSRLAAARTNGARTRAAIVGVVSEPLTAEEIADRLPDHRRDTVITAVSRLARQGWLHDSGQTRLSSAGCPRIVWIVGSPAAPDDPDPERE